MEVCLLSALNIIFTILIVFLLTKLLFKRAMITLQEENFHWNLNFTNYICRNLSMIAYIIEI